ncbi:hypothetical protein N7528_008048 [Penicillium herquei]|nr:hypothetical protein N7528_008048 [Penicillium herquei]
MEWKYTTHRPLSLQEALKKLRQEETSTASDLADGEIDKIRTDTVRVASVTRVGDELSWGRMMVGNENKWRFWGVYDGHVGWATSAILRDYLAKYVDRKLDLLSAEELGDATKVETAVKSAFIELDDEIISDGLAALYESIPHTEAMCRMAPAISGSCALLALYDPDRSTLYVAGTGDSRAVLGHRKFTKETYEWSLTLLSIEHTGLNVEERARIEAEHPGEDMFAGSRFLSAEVTRSFGYNRRKWPARALEDLKQGFFGRVYNNNIPTPPYATAEPDVISVQVQPGDFLILGTDGFWNHVSNEDAISCVSLWIEAQKKGDLTTLEQAQNHELLFPDVEIHDIAPKSPAEQTTVEKTESGDCPSQPLETNLHRHTYPYNWLIERDDFIAEEENVATHLVRNAFGGKDENLFCSLMSVLPPSSKEARDDVTVIVVLF